MISPTTILSLVGSIVSILAIFGIVINGDAVKEGLELLFVVFFAVSNLIIYVRKVKTGEVSFLGVRIKKEEA